MDDELKHFGILGMKWGIRRYQNPDGSLTAAGKARYNSDGTRKKAYQMSDEELRTANNRLNAENQYNDNIRRSMTIAQKVVASAIATSGAVLVKDIIVGTSVTKTIKNMLGASALAGITVAALDAGGTIYSQNQNKKK